MDFNPMNRQRRHFLQLLGLTVLGTQLPTWAQSPPLLKPPRLKPGDTVGLINPASQIDQDNLQYTINSLSQLGFNVKIGDHVLDQYGYLAGQDQDRAQDVNTMFTDDGVQALLAVRGGWGCNRILPLLDYELIRRHPKIIMGYSDITALLLAIYARSGLVTFHGPVGISTWNDFSVGYADRILLQGEATRLQNSPDTPVQTLIPGKAQGRLWGGNLSVITAMIGSEYLPDWSNTILFVEEVREEIYRVDRMLTQLKLAGILDQLTGFIFAQCRHCPPDPDDDPSLTLEQVLADHIRPLNIPAWYGSMIGHIRNKFTVPIGLPVEIDANLGIIQLLDQAVT